MAYKDLTPSERISAVHLDLMRDPEYSRVGPTTQLGIARIAGPECPTARTDGLDCWYNERWIMSMTREQLRYVVTHEQMHKMLMHCTLYNAAFKQHPDESGQAVDYVVNLMVEDMDKGRGFVQRPTDYPPLLDEKYRDMSCLEVLADLIRNKPPGGGGNGKPMDEHTQRQPGDGDAAAAAAEEQMIDDARVQGEITSSRLRGEGAGAASLKGFERTETDWREPLRQFMQDVMEGDEQSRWCPPNKLFRPLGILLPSHYTETAGELVVACDTSGSMRSYYARIFGEIGRVCEQVQPREVKVIWWDTRVAGVQTFFPVDYPQLKDKLDAKGGGGTTVSCVAQYMRKHGITPQATIILTDGEIESEYECPAGPLLWGVVGNARFRPLRGQLLRIGKESLL
jgi:predicted metal-dependent peptidase